MLPVRFFESSSRLRLPVVYLSSWSYRTPEPVSTPRPTGLALVHGGGERLELAGSRPVSSPQSSALSFLVCGMEVILGLPLQGCCEDSVG